jgi:aminopeptidase N
VVTVAEEPGQISVRQSRFLTTGDVKPQEDETTWWIPLGLTSGARVRSAGSALTVKEDTIRDIDNSFYKLNADQSGFYRTNYPPDRLMQLGQMRERLSTQDKIGLIGDATALAVAGDGTTAGLLTLLESFKDEESYL